MVFCLLLLSLINPPASGRSTANVEEAALPKIAFQGLRGQGQGNDSALTPTEPGIERPPLHETASSLARQVTDPSSHLTAVNFKNQLFERFYGIKQTGYQLLVQSVLPTDNFPFKLWRTTVRPTIPVLVVPDGKGGQVNGLGDVEFVQINFLVDKKWLAVGIGPTFAFPTASDRLLGQGKWQIGPAFLVAYKGTPKIRTGALIQHWVSFAGANDRQDTNFLSIQPFFALIFSKGWYVKTDPILTCDWFNGSKWTVPINLGIGKVVKIGRQAFSISLEPEFVISHPQRGGEQFLFRLTFSPLFPGLK